MNSPKNIGDGREKEKKYLFSVVSEASVFQISTVSPFLHIAEKERI